MAALAGSANTPIAAIILATELFGNTAGVFAAVVSVISFALSGHRSLYPSQILVRSKTPALAHREGKSVDEAIPRMGASASWLARLLERMVSSQK